MDIRGINSLVLAYLGDAVYEEKIRLYLLSKGINKVNLLQQVAINYVSAKRQAYFLSVLLERKFFNEEEISLIKRREMLKVIMLLKVVISLLIRKRQDLKRLLVILN